MTKMTLSEELQWRGQIKDTTFQDLAWLDKPRTFYLGTDPSSDSLQIGNLAVYMLARRLRKHGWKAVLLVGGATSLIGDPGGKTEERQLKSRQEIQANVVGINHQVKRLFAGTDYRLVDNYDWLKGISYLEFLREVGKNYSMTELLQRDFIASRIGDGGGGISYAEFSYSLMQGYDYWHLYKKYDVQLQIGGSDQWGNMLSGVPLIRKKENVEVQALSAPLVVNKATGQKFGKSEGGAVWLDESKTSVYKFYQFWLNAGDESVSEYLKIYTDLDQEELADVMKKFEADKSQRHAQRTLAREATKIVHGADRVAAVEKATAALFGEGEFLALKQAEVDVLKKELTVIHASHKDPIAGVIVSSGLASSNSEATRFIGGGSISINGVKVTPESIEFFRKGSNLLKRGKNSFAIVEIK